MWQRMSNLIVRVCLGNGTSQWVDLDRIIQLKLIPQVSKCVVTEGSSTTDFQKSEGRRAVDRHLFGYRYGVNDHVVITTKF